ncbi:MAG TPA: hypothetical protein VIG41_13175 [Micrococcaceae bacterium]
MAVNRRSWSPAMAATAAALLALVLSGCGAGGDSGSQSAGPGTTAAGGASSSASSSGGSRTAGSATPPAPGASTSGAPAGAEATAEPAAAKWKTFTDSGHKISFQLPQEWIAQQQAQASGVQPVALRVEVKDAAGRLMATLNTGMQGPGGACQPDRARPYTVLASLPMDIPSNASDAQAVPPRFVYRLLQGANKFYASYGITDHSAGTDGKACLVSNVVSGPAVGLYMFGDVLQFSSMDNPPAGLKAFDTIADAQKYMLTSEFQNLQKMITSLKIP